MLKRKPQTDFDAIYLLSPHEESVRAMLADYERGNRTYAKAFAFFTSRTRALAVARPRRAARGEGGGVRNTLRTGPTRIFFQLRRG